MWAGSVSWVCTKVEGPALELLIERDLRDTAEVSVLQHAETGLWWAVKTSGRPKTTYVCIYERIGCICVCGSLCGCIGICVSAALAIMFGCTVAFAPSVACLYARRAVLCCYASVLFRK